jgi:hypothetical protein
MSVSPVKKPFMVKFLVLSSVGVVWMYIVPIAKGLDLVPISDWLMAVLAWLPSLSIFVWLIIILLKQHFAEKPLRKPLQIASDVLVFLFLLSIVMHIRVFRLDDVPLWFTHTLLVIIVTCVIALLALYASQTLNKAQPPPEDQQ